MPWKIVSPHDTKLIQQIAKRASELTNTKYPFAHPEDLVFALRLGHLSMPLDLEALFAAEDDQFAGDVFGIHLNLRLRPGPIFNNNFTPRFARVQT